METISVNGADWAVERLLGKGKGGYSYLARREGRAAVVKQIHHEPCSYYQFGDKLAAELRDYERLRQVGIPMPALLEVDRAAERLVKEYIAGPTVFELVRDGQMRPEYLAQVEAMCALLYPAGLNIDYYPTNFIPQQGRLFYVDYECNPYAEQWDFDHWGRQYWARTPAFLKALEG
mgnify:CR=1 FL=1